MGQPPFIRALRNANLRNDGLLRVACNPVCSDHSRETDEKMATGMAAEIDRREESGMEGPVSGIR